MCVFESKTLEMNFRIRIGDIIVIRVGIEKQIGRIQDPNSSPSPFDSRHNIQSIEESFVLVEDPVSIGVLVDRYSVRPLGVVGWREGGFIVDASVVLVFTDDSQPGRIGVLPILDHPHPTSFIKIAKYRLCNDRLRQNLIES